MRRTTADGRVSLGGVHPYDIDLSRALRAAQDEVLRAEDYVWSYDEDDRPESVDALWADSYCSECGTHSILDMRGMVPDGDDTFATVIPLGADEAVRLMGTAEPDRAVFKQAYDTRVLDQVIRDRWGGACVIIRAEGAPSEIAFWGISGF